MMIAVHCRIILFFCVQLAMIVGLHKGSAGKVIYHGRNACNGHGEIIAHGFNGCHHAGRIPIGIRQLRQLRHEFLQIPHIFIAAANPCPGAVGYSRQFKVQVSNHLASPFRVQGVDLLEGTGGPIEPAVRYAPFFRRHSAENQGVLGLASAFHNGSCQSQHHGNSRVIILKAGKVAVVVGGKENQTIRVLSLNFADDVAVPCIMNHTSIRTEGHSSFAAGIQHAHQRIRIPPSHGEGRRIRRACNILGIQGFIIRIAVSAPLNGDQGFCALQMSLINRIIDPPLIPLVDVCKYQLALHIQAGVILGFSPANINQLAGFPALCLQGSLVSTKHSLPLSFRGIKEHLGVVKLPPIHRELFPAHMGQADVQHFLA